MTPTQFELLEVIRDLETDGKVKSLFQAASVALMEYSWGWRVLGQLENGGLVTVQRNGAGVPLRIETTETGRKAVLDRRQMHQMALPGVI